jgi:thiol-disulfide isomerase/thioredoxin
MKYLILSLIFLIAFGSLQAQRKVSLDSTAIVKDSAGNKYPFIVWWKLLSTNEYDLKPINRHNLNEGFQLVKLSPADMEKKKANAPKPSQSKFFTTGQEMGNFEDKDIEGNKWNLNDLKGKIVVMNFWYTGCAPCKAEMPELNKLVEQYKADSSVVFISFCLDDKSTIKDFLKTTVYDYKVIPNARDIAERYKIRSYPTNVVVDSEGKVQYHTSGLAIGTVPWVKKAIDSLLKRGS